jgi:hypothetical protein
MGILDFFQALFCNEDLEELRDRNEILAGEREFYRKASEALSLEKSALQSTLDGLELKLKELSKLPATHIVADFDRITTGRLTEDKPSPHSPLNKSQLKGIANNVKASSRELYVIELYGDTNSMEPDIDDNSIIVLVKYKPGVHNINVQDVVHYRHPEVSTLVLHRVEKVREDNGVKEYFIRGDNNPWGDGWFGDDAIIGIACGKFWGEEPDGESDD